MASIAYVNGVYRPIAQAMVAVEDRGLQFGDGVYEVIYVHRGRPVDADLHLARLARSLREIALPFALRPAALMVIIAEVLRRSRVSTGLVYMQVTRGAARRDHVFPAQARPGIIITARHRAGPPADAQAWAAAAITMADERWGRCDIKSTNLLPNVLAKQAAREAGAIEAILFDHAGMVTEAAASSVWMVDEAGVLRTRPLGRQVLPGCTREALLEILAGLGVEHREGAFSVQEMRAAREVFITSATSFVKPIILLDGEAVADGRAGPVSRGLLAAYIQRIEAA